MVEPAAAEEVGAAGAEEVEPAGDVTTFGPDAMTATEFSRLVAPLFERAPRFLAVLAAGRPYGSWERLFDRAAPLALGLPLDAQLELIDAHPRIGASPGSVSAHSFIEQGYARDSAAAGVAAADAERRHVAAELERLNDAYEARLGFRYVIFVAGRSRAQIVPLLEASLQGEVAAERERAIRDVVAIARDRAVRSGLMDEAASVAADGVSVAAADGVSGAAADGVSVAARG